LNRGTDARDGVSLDPVPLAARVRALLRPPDGVRVEAERAGVILTGHAPAAWIRAERAEAQKLAGVIGWQERSLLEDEHELLVLLQRSLLARRIAFDLDSVQPTDETAVEAAAAEARLPVSVAQKSGRAPSIELLGHADPSGTARHNDRLALERARRVRERFQRAEVDASTMTIARAERGEYRAVELRVRF